MRAVTWHGQARRPGGHGARPDDRGPDRRRSCRITSTGICGSDLHLYEVLGPFLDAGDILGHEPMGVVEEVGSEVTEVRRRATGWSCRSTSPAAPASCASRACSRSARPPRCTSRAPAPRCSATPSSTGRCPAGRPSTCGCRSATRCRSRCRTGRRTTGSSTCPTCCPPPGRPCEYADVPTGGSAGGARPRPDRRHGHPDRPAPRASRQVIGIDLVPERLERARAHGVADDRPARARQGPRRRRPRR